MKFRKKPVVIEATQWFRNGDHPLDFANERSGFQGDNVITYSADECRSLDFEGEVVKRFRHPGISGRDVCRHCKVIMHHHGWIDTLEGGHIVCPHDWIITGVNGEHYPCKPDIFNKTYEVAE